MWKRKQLILTPLSSSLFLLLGRRTTLTSTPHFSSFNPIPRTASSNPFVPLPCQSFFISSQFFGDKASSAASCWNCGAAAPEATPFLFCSSCRSIQPLDHSVDYFQIFGLERKYDSVEEHLEGKYKDWQKKLHPDLVHSKSEREREYAAGQSARVIDAYRTLSRPLARAIYILKLEGVDIDEEERLSDIDLLTEIMEIREAVDEAPDSDTLKQIQSLMQEKLKQWSNSFAQEFQSRNFEEAIKAIRRMKYYERVEDPGRELQALELQA